MINQIVKIVEPENNRFGIFLSGIEGASNYKLLKSLNIKGVLTTEQQCPVSYNQIPEIMFHYVVPVEENSDVSIYFEKTNQFLSEVATHGNALVQSFTGQDLAPVFIMAYLMKQLKLTADQACEYVKDQFKYANVSHEHFKLLLKYERSFRFQIQLKSTIRDNNHISQFKHLNPPPISNDKNKWDYLFSEKPMDIGLIKDQIREQEMWLQNYKTLRQQQNQFIN